MTTLFSTSFNMFNASFQSISSDAANFVNSTVVDAINTDALTGSVVVLFEGGSLYRYTNVSRRAIIKFNIDNARSMGKFLNTVLKVNGVVATQLAATVAFA